MTEIKQQKSNERFHAAIELYTVGIVIGGLLYFTGGTNIHAIPKLPYIRFRRDIHEPEMNFRRRYQTVNNAYRYTRRTQFLILIFCIKHAASC